MAGEVVMATASDLGMSSCESQHMLRNDLAIIVILHALSILCPVPGASMFTDLQQSSCIASWRMVSIIRCFMVLSIYLIDLHALHVLQPASCLIYHALICPNVATLNEEGLIHAMHFQRLHNALSFPCPARCRNTSYVHIYYECKTSTVTLIYKVVN